LARSRALPAALVRTHGADVGCRIEQQLYRTSAASFCANSGHVA